ncbi:hypothetical protein PMI13_03851, partial [Chryseobacterium populi]
MKKNFIPACTLVIISLGAQSNQDLMRQFEKQRIENNEKFEAYVSKHYGANKSADTQKKIEEQRSKLAGFTPDGNPILLEPTDLKQVKNSNADFLQNGTINGLTGSFNGENIKYTIFDGGRAFGGHVAFNNAPNRITNKEAATMNYSSHATAVTGFIGAKNVPLNLMPNGVTVSVNLKGVASNSTFDNYSSSTTILPGNSAASNILEKILLAAPKISNHSYNTGGGWNDRLTPGVLIWTGKYPSTIYENVQGAYSTLDRGYDQIVYNNPSYVIVKAAGNSFGIGPTGFGSTLPRYYRDGTTSALVLFTATDPLPPDNCISGYDCLNNGS